MVTDPKLRPGSLVRDNRSRVGRVVGSTGTRAIDGEMVDVVAVDFWGDEQKRLVNSLNVLEDDTPEALLLEKPATLESWADDAPLKLVALALSVDGGTGKVADIRAKLDDRVIGTGRWEGWWKRQPQLMRQLPEHFRIAKVGKDSEYTLLTSVGAVAASGDTKSARVAERGAATDWKAWLEAPTHTPAPGRFPTRQVATSLSRWPTDTIEAALLRLITSAEELSASRDAAAQAAEGWLRAVAQAALRWREVGGNDSRGYIAARVGEVLARLARIAGDRTPQDLLLQAGGIAGDIDAWRRGFLAGMWESFEGEDARDMYLNSAAVLGRQARSDLARETFAAAFGPDFSERRHSELDRLLDALPEEQRTQLLQEVASSASTSQRDGLLDYIAKSRHTSGPEHLWLRLVATLTMGGGQGELSTRTSRELADALEHPEKYGGSVQALIAAAAGKVVEVGFTAKAEVQKRSAEAQAKIDAERQEQERLRQQVRERNAELAANREESRLEVRQDMLLAVGEVLQSVSGGNASKGLAENVAAGLTLALRAGGAEPLETPGDMVTFDPERHQADGKVPADGAVSVTSPGVVYRGGTHGDRVLLKARVKHEAG